jgi:uncharacterized phage-associated protein
LNTPTTYTKNQIDKLGNALIFLCQNLEAATKTHLLKLVFIIEEYSVKKLGIPFFNLRFDVWKLGPVSRDLFVDLSDEPIMLADFIGKTVQGEKAVFVAKKDFSDDEFSDNDIAILKEVIDRFKYCTANELINFTHRKNSLWYDTAQRNGVLDLLETGKLTTTDIEINVSELIRDEDAKLSLYNLHKEFLSLSASLKS